MWNIIVVKLERASECPETIIFGLGDTVHKAHLGIRARLRKQGKHLNVLYDLSAICKVAKSFV